MSDLKGVGRYKKDNGETIEAIQFIGDKENLANILRFAGTTVGLGNNAEYITVKNWLGIVKVLPHDWIVKAESGQFYRVMAYLFDDKQEIKDE